MTALLGGHVMASSVAGSGYAPFVASGQVRLLAVYSPERVEDYPEVPTLRELGYPLEVQGHYIISGPKNMDKAIVKKLEKAFKMAIDSPDHKKLMKRLAVGTRNLLSGSDLKKALIRRSAMNRETFKKAGIKTRQ